METLEIYILQFWGRKSLHICCEIVLNLYLNGYNIKLNGMSAVATPGTLSRVFLFHFEKISGVLVNTGQNSRFGLKKKKKKILKTKTNLHSVHQKTSKWKKKWKENK